MTRKSPNMMKANSLEDLARKFFEKIEYLRDFTTGKVKDILQVSQQMVIGMYGSGWFGEAKVPGSTHRRISISNLVNGLKTNWGDFEKQYPQRQLLHLMEVLELNPGDYGLDGFAGRGGLRFHVQEDLYSTGKVAGFMGVSQQAIIRAMNQGIIGSYRRPLSNFRWTPAGDIVRYARDNNIPLTEKANNLSSPELINYPGNFSGKGKEGIEWDEKDRVTYIVGGQSVWYRSKGKVHEFSVRRGEDGLYIKCYDIEEASPIIYFTLLGKARGYGINLEKDEILSRVNRFLGKGNFFLNNNFCSGDKDKILEILKKVNDRFDAVYPLGSYKTIWRESY